jgi:RNA polymerase sigma-70 factor, ECF subfamily
LDDLEFARKLAERHEAAVRRLIDDYHSPVFRFLRQLTGRQEDAEDLTQQTFIRILATANRYDGRAPFRSWLYRYAINEYKRWRRRRVWLPLSPELPSGGDPIENVLDARLLLDGLSRLSIEHRTAFLLHYVEGLSLDEIAAATRIPAGTVKSRLYHARNQLRSHLGTEEIYAPTYCES